jgi:hypothetical protein
MPFVFENKNPSKNGKDKVTQKELIQKAKVCYKNTASLHVVRGLKANRCLTKSLLGC